MKNERPVRMNMASVFVNTGATQHNIMAQRIFTQGMKTDTIML